MKKIISSLSIFSFCLILTGCGINASTSLMTYEHHQTKKPANKNLLHAITVSEVTGGHTVSPLILSEISNENYKLALEQSLQSAQLFKNSPAGRYSLKASIVRFERPMGGLDMKSTLIVNYHLYDTQNNKLIFDKNIKSSHVAKISDSIVGMTRLKIANEGAAKDNIKQLIAHLYKI